jgi:cysteine desulfurase
MQKQRVPMQCCIQQRSYVSETKPINATVNVETAIKADQKAFVKNVRKQLEDLRLPGSNISATATMSPGAGKSSFT